MGEEMFKDLALSKDSMSEYHSKLAENSLGRQMNAMVLQRSAWPFSVQKHTVDLPFAVRPFPPLHGCWKPYPCKYVPDAGGVDKVYRLLQVQAHGLHSRVESRSWHYDAEGKVPFWIKGTFGQHVPGNHVASFQLKL